jgi:hypothetical protein
LRLKPILIASADFDLKLISFRGDDWNRYTIYPDHLSVTNWLKTTDVSFKQKLVIAFFGDCGFTGEQFEAVKDILEDNFVDFLNNSTQNRKCKIMIKLNEITAILEKEVNEAFLICLSMVKEIYENNKVI